MTQDDIMKMIVENEGVDRDTDELLSINGAGLEELFRFMDCLHDPQIRWQ